MANATNAPWFIRNEARTMSGGLDSPVGGRSDRLGMNVKPGAYVVPADSVSALGHGNSRNGMQVLDQMFKSGPYGMHMPRPSARAPIKAAPYVGPRRISNGTPPRLASPAARSNRFASGGPVPIAAAGGEYVIEPESIIAKFGDLESGHAILDQFVRDVREDYIKTLRSLPGPQR